MFRSGMMIPAWASSGLAVSKFSLTAIKPVSYTHIGYCCYRDVEGGNVLYPVWQIECDYAFDPAKQLSPDESYPVMERMHYSTMIVNAQTGEFMNPVNLKDKLLDAPKVTSWKDVR